MGVPVLMLDQVIARNQRPLTIGGCHFGAAPGCIDVRRFLEGRVGSLDASRGASQHSQQHLLVLYSSSMRTRTSCSLASTAAMSFLIGPRRCFLIQVIDPTLALPQMMIKRTGTSSCPPDRFVLRHLR